MYELTETERNAALQLNADYRYDHFLMKVCQHGLLWILKNEQGPLMLEDEGETCLPLWPHPDYATHWQQGELAEYQPQSITLEIWLERWAESLQQNQIAVAIFPVPDDSGIVEEAEELAATLDAKLDPEQE